MLNILKSKKISAKVIAKEEIKPVNAYTPFNVYTVTFEFEDRRVEILRVPQEVHDSLIIGVKGILVYAGKKFKEFIVATD